MASQKQKKSLSKSKLAIMSSTLNKGEPIRRKHKAIVLLLCATVITIAITSTVRMVTVQQANQKKLEQIIQDTKSNHQIQLKKQNEESQNQQQKLQQEVEVLEDPAARTLAKLQSPEGMTVAELMSEIGPLVSRYGVYFKVKTSFRGQPSNMNVTDLQYNLDRGATLPEDKVYFGDQPGKSRGYSREREAEINAGLNDPPMYSGRRYRGRYGRY